MAELRAYVRSMVAGVLKSGFASMLELILRTRGSKAASMKRFQVRVQLPDIYACFSGSDLPSTS